MRSEGGSSRGDEETVAVARERRTVVRGSTESGARPGVDMFCGSGMEEDSVMVLVRRSEEWMWRLLEEELEVRLRRGCETVWMMTGRMVRMVEGETRRRGRQAPRPRATKLIIN